MFDVVVLWLEVRPDSQEIEETIFYVVLKQVWGMCRQTRRLFTVQNSFLMHMFFIVSDLEINISSIMPQYLIHKILGNVLYCS